MPAAARVHFVAQTSMLSTICDARSDASILTFSHSVSVFVPMYSTGNRRNAEAASPDRPSVLLTSWRRFIWPVGNQLPPPSLFQEPVSQLFWRNTTPSSSVYPQLGMTLIGTSVTDWTPWFARDGLCLRARTLEGLAPLGSFEVEVPNPSILKTEHPGCHLISVRLNPSSSTTLRAALSRESGFVP